MTNKPVTDSLKVVLADSYALYLKTQNYHWNVEGPNFKSLHELFEMHYTDLAAAIDEIAERIRTLGEKAPGNWDSYKALTSIKNGDENATAETMTKELAEDQEVIAKPLGKALASAQQTEDEVTIGLVTDRLAIHQKNAWMLRSSL
jgi:starvation-inducible DNA-binding protein